MFQFHVDSRICILLLVGRIYERRGFIATKLESLTKYKRYGDMHLVLVGQTNKLRVYYS